MSVNQKINRVVSRSTKIGAKAQKAGQVLASFYAEGGKDEFAIDYLTRYGGHLAEHHYSSDNPVSAQLALDYVMDSVDVNYVPVVKGAGIPEARILTYVMEMGLMLNETLADPEAVLAVMAAMIDVAMRVNQLNRSNKVDDSWRASINKAISVTAKLGYRKAADKDDDVDAYALACAAMEQLDGDRGDYGSVTTLVEELYAALNPIFMPKKQPKIVRFSLADLEGDSAATTDETEPDPFDVKLWEDETPPEPPIVLRTVASPKETPPEPDPFDVSLWG